MKSSVNLGEHPVLPSESMAPDFSFQTSSLCFCDYWGVHAAAIFFGNYKGS